MQEIVFATNNTNKIREVQELMGQAYRFRSLTDIGCREELPETSDTLEGNALQKGRYVWDHFRCNCFSEDTGLEVYALGGAPGVITARYAGEARSPQANMNLLLTNLQGNPDRSARFRTVIALILDGREWLFEGIVEGRIAEAPRGDGGFGYDPIFEPEGLGLTFAEMASDAKHRISHRGRAMTRLQAFLSDPALSLSHE
jgi:XTP/dITP diphosphohydrolase